MFTGIIQHVAVVAENKGGKLAVKVPKEFSVRTGSSVSVNGACLTQLARASSMLLFEISNETRKRTNLGSLRQGDRVNLERAIRAGERFEGHIVLGHVDTTSSVISYSRARNQKGGMLTISMPQKYARYIVKKGSIAIDGVSLTVAEHGANSFSIAVVSYTHENTIVAYYTKGTPVNIEFDIIGKYIEKIMKNMVRQRAFAA